MNIKTTSFPCGGPQLKARAQESAAAVGLSLNGFVCVALDAYLSATVPPPAMPPTCYSAPLHFPQWLPAAAPAASLNRQQRRAKNAGNLY